MPLPYVPWRPSFYKGWLFAVSFLWLVSAAYIGCIQDAFAQKTPVAGLTGQAVILTDNTPIYDLTSHLYVINDPSTDLSAREVYLRHRNGIFGDRVTAMPIDLSLKRGGTWLVLDINNQSRTAEWVLDFGSVFGERTGFARHILIHEGQRNQTWLDYNVSGLTPEAHGTMGLHGGKAHLSLPPGQTTTLVIYFKVSDQAPFQITPRLLSLTASLAQNAQTAYLPWAIIVFLGAASVAFAVGMSVRKGFGLFPFALFLGVQALWLALSQTHIIVTLPGAAHIPALYLCLSVLLALACTQSVLAISHDAIEDSLLIYIVASFVLLALMVFVFIVPPDTPLRQYVLYGACGAAWLVALGKTIPYNRFTQWEGWALSLAWIITAYIHLLPFAGMTGLASTGFAYNGMSYWVGLPIVALALLLCGAFYQRHAQSVIIRGVLRQAQHAQALSRLKQSQESADQARLLRVIEREREIMEELRTREAERTEEMRKAKIIADEANRAKSAFLAVVSHEIRTPMTGIMGMLRMLMDTPLNREQRDYAQTIQDSGDAMLALLNDILDFSKIQSGGMDLELVDFDLKRLIDSIVMLMQGHASQRGITLKATMAPDVPRYVQGDPVRLRQVLLNLVGNAIKFTPQGGVTVHLRPVAWPDSDTVSLYFGVQDTGIGISEEAQKNLFSPFSQADSSIARKFGGTGLGLAICKRLIEAMGSDITLDSVEGQGSVFAFTLVMKLGSAASATTEGLALADSTPRQTSFSLRVLCVDDNAVNGKVMAGLLQKAGHDVMVADSARMALELVTLQAFDVIFMDVEMPEMDGLSATRALKAMGPPMSLIPVVALTGNVAAEDTERAREAGMEGTLAKPINPEALSEILAEIAARSGTHFPSTTSELRAAELEEDSFAQSVSYMTPHHSAGSVEASGLVDMGTLETLRSSLGAASLQDMLAGVFDHNRESLPALQNAFTQNAIPQLMAKAHELKGMNGNFGLKHIAAQTAILEQACREGRPLDAVLHSLAFEQLPHSMAETEKLLRQWLNL